MNKSIKLGSLFALTLGLAVSCSKNPDAGSGLSAPGGLRADVITEISARLHWDAVDGADGYNVSIDQGEVVRVDDTSYRATGLTGNTTYTWRVQALQGNFAGEWASGPDFRTTDGSGPTGLLVSGVGATTATLTWNFPGADRHEVVIGNAPAVTTAAPTYAATGLQTLTGYTWKVRSQTDGVWSDWSDGENFTTVRARLANIHPNSNSGNYYGANTLNYNFTITEYLLTDVADGMFWEMDFIFSTSTMNLAKTEEFLDIPVGEYEINNTKGAGTAYMSRCWGGSFERGAMIDVLNISNGTVTVEGDRNNYRILFDIEWYNRDYTDLSGEYHAEFIGPYNLPNPYYVVQGGDEIQLDMTNSLQYKYTANHGFTGERSSFTVKASDSAGVTHSNGIYTGNGWVFMAQFLAPFDCGTMPDGEYPVNTSFAPGTAYAWVPNSGTRLARLGNGAIVESIPIVAGKITSAFSSPDGIYTLTLDCENEGGRKITGTVRISNTSPGL